MRIITFFALCAILFTLGSCKVQEDLNDLQGSYSPEAAIPLFYSKFNLKDIVGNKNASALKISPDGKMNLFYKSAYTERKASDILKIFAGSAIPILFKDTISYLPALKSSEVNIRKILYKKGVTMSLSIQNLTPNITEPISVRVWIPTLIRKGLVFEHSYFGLLASGKSTILINKDELVGYTLTPLPVGSDSIQLRYTANTISGKPVSLQVLGLLENPAFTYLEGFIPKKEIAIDNGSVDVSVYNQVVTGDLTFEEPKISVLVENSYGYPMRSKLNLVRAIGKKGDTIALKTTALANGNFDFPYAALNEVGKTKYKTFDFTNANSNIKELLNSAPNTILYDIDAIANPDDVTVNGFMTDSTNLRIGVEVDIPMFGSAKNFEGRDTISNLDLSVLDNVQAAEIKFASDNQLPVAIAIQGLFLDASGRILDNLAAAPFKLVDAAQVDAKGNVTKSTPNEVIIPLTMEKIAKIRSATRLVLTANFETSQKGVVPVRILSSQEVNLRAGIRVTPK
jgi:hypothetical protein